RVHEAGMAGLAFSGGGVRSATFNLGVLQALGELHLLRHFDYLSTVSGGGYIGAWLSKWLHRTDGDIDRMEHKLNPTANPVAGKDEPEEVRFLRQFSNYLTVKTGLFSADTWTVLATYVRNALLNMTMLVACLASVLVLTRLVVAEAGKHVLVGTPSTLAAGWLPPLAVLAIGAALWSVFWIAVSISTHPDPAKPQWRHGQSQGNIIRRIVCPLMLAALCASIVLWDARGAMGDTWRDLATSAGAQRNVALWLLAPGVCYFLVWAGGWTMAQYDNSFSGASAAATPGMAWRKLFARVSRRTLGALFKEGLGHFLCALAALAVGALLVILTTAALARNTARTAPAAAAATASPPDPLIVHVLAFGMPLLLALFAVTTILSVGLVGRMYSEKSREWWSRQSAWTAIFVLAWLAFVSMGLYAPAVLAYAHVKSHGWVSAMLGTTWIGSTLSGLLAGIGKGKHATPRPQTGRGTGVIIAMAPYVFVIGLLMLASGLVHWLSAGNAGRADDAFLSIVHQYNAQTVGSDAGQLLWTLLATLLIGALLAWRVDINRFSLHMMYRNRLVRTYLGASSIDRHAHPFTGFDEQDDIDFSAVLQKKDGKIQRPHHIINCALNMVHGRQLAWQTRKAAGFAFTPAFCGFELPSMAAPGGPKIADEALRGCYRSTASYRPAGVSEKTEDSGIKLGLAMAVSGAAVSPNWGNRTTPALAVLMTLFNARLGRWFANPRRKLKPGDHTSPRVGIVPLLSELFGLTDAQSDFVYLSDGGHFEDLGIYELVRRRCRLIVAVDASADGKPDFGDLGNAIRKCATDLHVDICLNVARIDPLRDALVSRDHCVAGVIDYGKADGADAPAGILLYIKPSLVGTETADLLNYSKTSGAFPHQTTLDQWFDETQFESYRTLGYQIAKTALADAAGKARIAGTLGHDMTRLCQEIKAGWCRSATGEPCEPHAVRRGPERRHWDAAGAQSAALLRTFTRGPERRRWDTA
ncbi:MAG: hypothetical protein QFF03_23210, partial [Pseudomonadota bacterium]|nr:hypothetical protein [Pseudomonadota bacterium]